MRRIHRAVAGLVAVTAALTAPAAAGAAQLVVDDDRRQCPAAGYTAIAPAIAAAAAGDTVSVCDGTYREGAATAGTTALTIDKSLTLKGAGARKVYVGPAGNIAATAPNAQDAAGTIVAVTGAGTTADLSGFTVFGDSRAIEAGVGYYDARGAISSVEVTDVAGAVGITGVATSTTALVDMTIEDSLVEGYGPAGIVLDAGAQGETGAPRGRFALVTGNRVTGLGDPGVEQDGIVLRGGASAVVVENAIADNGPRRTGSAAIEAIDHRASSQTRFNLNSIQGNGFGARQALAPFTPNPNPILDAYRGLDAAQNWWGDASGPFNAATNNAAQGQPVNGTTQGSRPPNLVEPQGARVPLANTTDQIDYRDVLTAPAPVPSPLSRFADEQPAVAFEAPAEDAVLTPGTPTTLRATAADDVGVGSVTFRQGATVLGTDDTPPYEAAYTPAASLAGTSQALTATATDSAGQTTAVARSVRIAAPPGPPPAVEDAPPAVSITAPTGTVRRGRITLSATATDDRGVAAVDFLLDDRRVCRDTTAPYTCTVTPRGTDVGRTALVVTATDTAGQTATAVRTLKIPTIAPRSLSATSKVGGRRITTTGRLSRPSTVSRSAGCRGRVTLTYSRGGRRIATRSATLSRSCAYRVRASVGRGRITVRARFAGNDVLAAKSARTRKVTVR